MNPFIVQVRLVRRGGWRVTLEIHTVFNYLNIGESSLESCLALELWRPQYQSKITLNPREEQEQEQEDLHWSHGGEMCIITAEKNCRLPKDQEYILGYIRECTNSWLMKMLKCSELILNDLQVSFWRPKDSFIRICCDGCLQWENTNTLFLIQHRSREVMCQQKLNLIEEKMWTML